MRFQLPSLNEIKWVSDDVFIYVTLIIYIDIKLGCLVKYETVNWSKVGTSDLLTIIPFEIFEFRAAVAFRRDYVVFPL